MSELVALVFANERSIVTGLLSNGALVLVIVISGTGRAVAIAGRIAVMKPTILMIQRRVEELHWFRLRIRWPGDL